MSRELSEVTIDNISRDVVNPFFAVEFNFDATPIRVWTGLGTLVIDGIEWVGSGELMSISSIEETSELAVKGATLNMSGIPSELLSLALSEPYQGRICTIYFGTFSVGSLLQESGSYILKEDGSKILLETGDTGFNEIFSGYMDQMDITEGPDTSSIEMRIENKLIDLERSRIARFTSGYQKSMYPGDLGLDFVESLQDRKLAWGRSAS